VSKALAVPDQNFLLGGGEMGRLIRNYDWTRSSLGPVSGWPQSLRVAVRLLLTADLPMVLWWGERLVLFYNNAYRDTMAPGPDMRPLGMECSGRIDPIWQLVGPGIQSIMDGNGALSGLDVPVPAGIFDADPRYWDYDLCPVDLRDGVGGVIGILKEVSADHDDDEKLNRTSAQLIRLFEHAPAFICVFSGPEHVYEFVNVQYRTLMGDRNYIGQSVRNIVPEIAGQGFFELLDTVFQTGETFTGKGLPMIFQPVPGADLVTVSVDLVYKALIAASGDVYGVFVEGTYGPVAAVYDLATNLVLTEREREVLGWIALGKTAGEAATILGLSKRTIETHIYSAARKLDTANSTHTVVEAIRRGELSL